MDHKIIFPQELVKAVNESVGSVYQPPVLIEANESVYGLEGVLSTIYLKGDVIGKISLFMRGSHAAKLVANMLGVEDIAEDSIDVLDGVGEVLNIMVGCFKKHLEPHQIKVDISVPSTRMTGILTPGRWANNIDQVYTSNDVVLKVSMSYRHVEKEERPSGALLSGQAKMKLSAADLLKQILAKKK